MQDEQAVILRAQQGDQDAFAALVSQHEELAFRAAYLVVRDEAEAQDVAQEAFMRAYNSLGRFDVGQPFRPWLLRIVTNLAINSRRSAGRREAMTTRYEQRRPTSALGASPEDTAVSSEQAQRVWQAVSSLEARDQALLYLRYFLDSSEEETAAALGRPAGTVKSRLHRALRKLRGVIRDEYPDLLPERSRAKA